MVDKGQRLTIKNSSFHDAIFRKHPNIAKSMIACIACEELKRKITRILVELNDSLRPLEKNTSWLQGKSPKKMGAQDGTSSLYSL